MIDGQKRGTSPTTIEGLLPGVHMVTVEGQLGSVTQDVTIESGVTAARNTSTATSRNAEERTILSAPDASYGAEGRYFKAQ